MTDFTENPLYKVLSAPENNLNTGNKMNFVENTDNLGRVPHRQNHAHGDILKVQDAYLTKKIEEEKARLLAAQGRGGDDGIALMGPKTMKAMDNAVHGGKKHINPNTGLREYAKCPTKNCELQEGHGGNHQIEESKEQEDQDSWNEEDDAVMEKAKIALGNMGKEPTSNKRSGQSLKGEENIPQKQQKVMINIPNQLNQKPIQNINQQSQKKSKLDPKSNRYETIPLDSPTYLDSDMFEEYQEYLRTLNNINSGANIGVLKTKKNNQKIGNIVPTSSHNSDDFVKNSEKGYLFDKGIDETGAAFGHSERTGLIPVLDDVIKGIRQDPNSNYTYDPNRPHYAKIGDKTNLRRANSPLHDKDPMYEKIPEGKRNRNSADKNNNITNKEDILQKLSAKTKAYNHRTKNDKQLTYAESIRKAMQENNITLDMVSERPACNYAYGQNGVKDTNEPKGRNCEVFLGEIMPKGSQYFHLNGEAGKYDSNPKKKQIRKIREEALAREK